MLMNDVEKNEDVQNIIIKNLRSLGVKYRSKKISKKHQDSLVTNNVFNKPLNTLQLHTIKMENNTSLQIPQLVHELCSYISCNLETEGIFRKAGSAARQKEIKLLLNAGCELSSEHHVIDVANVLKLFFRELPEPLIPYAFHDLFLQCLLTKKSDVVNAIMLSCLLLPALHLSTLSYFMEFLHRVVTYSKFNKMDVKNIAIVMTPTIMPIQDKVIAYTCQRLSSHVQIIQILVEHADKIGIIPENIRETIFHTSTNSGNSETDHSYNNAQSMKKKKKRRSASLTRMFNGLKKMVGAKSTDDICSQTSKSSISTTPDLLRTPIITRSAKKRKAQAAGFSNKRRKELMTNLPQGSALVNTPFKTAMTPVCLNPKPEIKEIDLTPIPLGKNSTSSLPEVKISIQDSTYDYVRISKNEYEEIKSRVSVLEEKISQELTNVQNSATPSSVQTAYEKTLEEVDGLNSPTTDQLAKRLSKELKIRRNSDHKIIRSPSARKIGSLRRRSQELTRLSRNQSCHIPRVTLKRGRPNTVMTGLPHPSPLKSTELNLNPIEINRSSSFHSYKNENWSNGETFFQKNNPEKKSELRRFVNATENRDSLARLRSQNAGMVLARARLFDDLSDSGEMNGEKSQENNNKKILRRGGTFPRQPPPARRTRLLTAETEKENEILKQKDGVLRSRSKTRSPRTRRNTISPRSVRQ